MSDLKMSNIPSMSVGKIVEVLGNLYCTIININLSLQRVL